MDVLNTTFFCGLDQIRLSTTTRRGERFFNDYYITRDRSKIAEIAFPLVSSIGSLEYDYLTRQSNAIIYRHDAVKVGRISASEINSIISSQIIKDMLVIRSLDMALWSIKDNACHFDRAWIIGNYGKECAIHSNTWSSRHSCADGTFRPTAFSTDELRVARQSERPIATYLDSSVAPTALNDGLLRFQRFEYFIGGARANADVAVKIAEYCTALEALVSTAHSELSHQVSERVAALLAPPGADRVGVFKVVKQAYNYRSKTVHGAFFRDRDIVQLRECSRKVDSICRALNYLYFSEDETFRTAAEGNQKAYSNFFEEVVLGDRPVQKLIEVRP